MRVQQPAVRVVVVNDVLPHRLIDLGPGCREGLLDIGEDAGGHLGVGDFEKGKRAACIAFLRGELARHEPGRFRQVA